MTGFDADAVVAQAKDERSARIADFLAARTASRALYADDGQPTLLPSFVVYLDELGTSARLMSMSNEDLRDDLRAYDELRVFLHDDVRGWDRETQRTLYFSDNLVVVSPATTDGSNLDLGLFRHIWTAAAYQLNMAIRGRLLRGGITAGEAYADDTFVTGPAHLCAVLLEEKVADNPRIVLDDLCVDLAREDRNKGGYTAAHASPYESFLLNDADKRTFVNYLIAVSEDEGLDSNVIATRLAAHGEKIEVALASDPIEKVRAKLSWVAAYHNYVCESFYGRRDLAIAGIAPVTFSRFR